MESSTERADDATTEAACDGGCQLEMLETIFHHFRVKLRFPPSFVGDEKGKVGSHTREYVYIDEVRDKCLTQPFKTQCFVRCLS